MGSISISSTKRAPCRKAARLPGRVRITNTLALVSLAHQYCPFFFYHSVDPVNEGSGECKEISFKVGHPDDRIADSLLSDKLAAGLQ